MSGLEVDLTLQQMEENGEMDFIRSFVTPEGGETPEAPADEAATATVEDEEIEDPGADPDGDAQATSEIEDEEPDDEIDEGEPDGFELVLSPEVEALLAKYDGDLNAALAAAVQAQSAVGRKNNELGDLRREIAEMRAAMEAGFVSQTPYAQWPDEEMVEEDPRQAVLQYRAIADAAFERQDGETFNRAMQAWQEIDPIGNEAWATVKAMQVQMSAAPEESGATGGDPEATRLSAALAEKHPDLRKPEVQAAIGELARSRPTLERLLREATPVERVQILEDLYLEVASRNTSATVRKARVKVAAQASEEARRARQEGQVLRQTGGRGSREEATETPIKLGDTGQAVSLEAINALLPEGDKIELGASGVPGIVP